MQTITKDVLMYEQLAKKVEEVTKGNATFVHVSELYNLLTEAKKILEQ